MKTIKIILLVLLLTGCNNIFDLYYGDDLYAIENSIVHGYPDCWTVNKVLNEDTEKEYYIYDDLLVLKESIYLYTPTGNRYDWYITKTTY